MIHHACNRYIKFSHKRLEMWAKYPLKLS